MNIALILALLATPGTGRTAGDAILHVDAFRPDGTLAWCRTIADAPWDRAAIGVSPVGHLVTAFSSRGRTPRSRAAVLAMAFDPNGDMAWSTTLEGEAGAAEMFTAMAFDAKGGTWLASKQTPVAEGVGRELWLFRRFTGTGRLAWTRSACFGSCAGAPTALVPAQNGVVIIGIEDKVSVAAHFPLEGWPDWTWVDERAHLTAAAPVAGGGLIGAGVRPAPGGGVWEIVKLTAGGAVAWTRTAGRRPYPQSPARATTVAVTKSGDALVAGTITGPTVPPASDWMIQRYAPDGTLRWERTWNSGNDKTRAFDDAPSWIAAGPDASAYVLGTARKGTEPATAWLQKYSPAGQLLWSRTAPGDRALGVTTSGLILTAGTISTP